MRRGMTTMKIISSTSTTSTSGVMLISDCRSEPLPSVLNCMMSFPLRVCASALRDQPHSLEASLVDRDHGLAHSLEVQPRISPEHNLRFRLVAHRSAEGFPEILRCDLLFVDPQPTFVVDGDQDPS